ncbi:MAG: DUF3604 domain-containing protein [Anaerolineales bacterium]|nr:DUF3604 domain-containing protein [Anaerolineales bacterium]
MIDSIADQISLGKATIQPDRPVVAGSYATVIFTFTAGHPVDDSGYVKIAFRTVGDFGKPQFDNPSAPNYCSILTNGDCRIEPRWDPKGHTRPWSQAIYLKIRGGFLNKGEEIILTFGDTSGGSAGWQMQSFCERSFEFKTLVDPIATYRFKELTDSPTLRIVPGEPARAVCVASSQVKANQEFYYYLKLEDRWGNPTAKPKILKHPGFTEAGVRTITSKDEPTDLSAQSNPIEILEGDVPLRSFWADFHGQTEETVGTNAIDDYFVFARDYAFLDIVAHQGNDFQITDEFWGEINRVTKAYYQPGAFVTFPGYEWSGNTPLGGDRNVFFAAEGGQITRSCTDLLPDNLTAFENSPTAAELFCNLKKQTDLRPFVFAHVGGRYADIGMHDPEIELAVEAHSAWGTFEWLLEDAFQRGYRLGICANSDGHKCRPGASYPGARKFGSYGGLTCVLAQRLDRESVFEALTCRHFYATTGNRSLLDVRLESGYGRSFMMGDIVALNHAEIDRLRLHVKVVGTSPVERVEVRNGSKLIETFRPFDQDDLGSRVKILWSGAEVFGRDRLVPWDGSLRVSGNTILDVVPINFWNADQPLKIVDSNQLTWKSITTGGVSGVILKLEKPSGGRLEVKTLQGNLACEIDSLGLTPKVWEYGGLQKKIEIYSLPDHLQSGECSFTLPLTALGQGDNPIYVRMQQENGHMAWSSPIYVCNSGG